MKRTTVARTNRNRRTHAFAVLVALVAAAIFTPAARAADYIWDGGGGDDNWGTTANWNPDGVVYTGSGNYVHFAGSTRTTPYNNYTAWDDFGGIVFDSGAGVFTISGNAIDLFGKIENNSSSAQTVNLEIGTGTLSGSYIEMNPVSGNLTIGGANVYLGNNQLRVWGNNGYTLTFGASTIISGTSATVAINQNSTVVYNSAHTYTGDTYINAGTLQFNSGASASSSTIRLGDTTGTAAATLAVASGATVNSTINVRSGSSGTKTINSLATSGTATVSGSIYLDAATTATSASGGTLSFTGATFDIKGQTLTVNGAGNTSISGSLQNSTGSGALVKSGNGTLTLSGSNTYTGNTTVSAGTLKISGGGGIYRGGYRTPTLTVSSGGVLELETWNYNTSTASLGGLSANTANFVINGGTVRMSNTSATSYGRGVTLNGSATLDANGSALWTIDIVTDNNNWTYNNNSITLTGSGSGGGRFDKVFSGSGSLTKSGTGTWTLGGANTFTGSLTANNGTLVVSNTLRSVSGVTANSGSTIKLNATNMFVGGHGTALSNTMVLTANSGTLLMDTGMESRVGNITLSNGGTLTSNRAMSSYDVLLADTSAGAATVTVNGTGAATMNGSGGIHLQGVQKFDVADVTGNSNTDLTVSMILGGPGTSGGAAGGINKLGAGTMSLSNANNTFNGDITINNGVLIGTGVSGNTNTALGLASGSRTITVNSNGTLSLVGNNVFGGSAQTLANTPKVVVNAGGTMTINTYNVVGNIDLNGGTLTATGSSNSSYQTYEFNGSTITVGGTSASTISSSAASNGGMHIAGGKTLTLNVGDIATGTDLAVSAALINGSSDRPGNGALLKTGAGTVKFTGANTYTGGTTVDNGTLILAGGPNWNTGIINGTATVNNGGTLELDFNTSGPIYPASSSDTINVNGGGTLYLNNLTSGGGDGANSYIGTVNLNSSNGSAAQVTGANGGSLRLGFNSNGLITSTGSVANTWSAKITLVNGNSKTATINTAAGNSLTVSGVIYDLSGYTGLTLNKTGSGTLKLSGGNTYSGNTTISGGTIVAANSSALGTAGTVTLNDASTGSTNTSLLIDASAGDVNLGRAISVTNNGTGTVTIGSSGLAASRVATFSGAITLNKDVTLTAVSGGDRTDFTGGIGGTGNVTISNTGRIIFSGATANTYNGTTTITAGSVLQLSDGTARTTDYLPDTGIVTVNGTLKLAKGNNSETIGGLSGSGTVQGHEGVINVASVLAVNNSSNCDFSGNLSNGGASGATLALTKQGAGTLTLSGSNTYTGATAVNNGTLNITGSVASSAITVNSNARLNLDGTASGDVIVNTGGLLTGTGTAGGDVAIYGEHSPGNSPGIDDVGGDLTYGSESVLTWELTADSDANRGTDFDGVNMTGTGKPLTITSGATIDLVFNLAESTVDFTDPFWGVSHSWLVIDNQDIGGTASGTFAIGTISLDPNNVDVLTQHPGFSFNTSISGNDLYLNYIPEPATVGLVGLFGLVTLLRRRLLGR